MARRRDFDFYPPIWLLGASWTSAVGVSRARGCWVILESDEDAKPDDDERQPDVGTDGEGAEGRRRIGISVRVVLDAEPRLPRVIPTTRIGHVVDWYLHLLHQNVAVALQVKIQLRHVLWTYFSACFSFF